MLTYMEYKCECCNYTTLKRFNYDKHLASIKHNKVKENTPSQQVVIFEASQSQHQVIQKSPQVAEKVAPDFTCKYCEQKFKFKQSMYRHIKYTCTKNTQNEYETSCEDLKEMLQAMKLNMEQQTQEMKRHNERLETHARQLELLTLCIHNTVQSTLPVRNSNEPT